MRLFSLPGRPARRGSCGTPQSGFSRASRSTRALMFRRVAGLPALPRMDLAAQRRRTMSRCQDARMIRRKTNRRHMTGDHHGQTAGRATLQVTATDEILGTHTPKREHLTRSDLGFPRSSAFSGCLFVPLRAPSGLFCRDVVNHDQRRRLGWLVGQLRGGRWCRCRPRW
jgi:hypothetical protein